MLQRAGQVEIVGAGVARRHAGAGAIDLAGILERRCVAHHVAALDQYVRSGKTEVGRALWIDGHEGDVEHVVFGNLDDVAGAFEGDQFQRNVQPARQFARDLNRDAARFGERWAAVREHDVAEVDGCPQYALGCDYFPFHENSAALTGPASSLYFAAESKTG